MKFITLSTYNFTSIDGQTNNMRMHAVSAYTSGGILDFLNSASSSYNATD